MPLIFARILRAIKHKTLFFGTGDLLFSQFCSCTLFIKYCEHFTGKILADQFCTTFANFNPRENQRHSDKCFVNFRVFYCTCQRAGWNHIGLIEPLSVTWRETGHYPLLGLHIWQTSEPSPFRFLLR